MTQEVGDTIQGTQKQFYLNTLIATFYIQNDKFAFFLRLYKVYFSFVHQNDSKYEKF